MEPPALLTIGHGTRNPRGAEEMDVLLGHVRDRLEGPVAHAWLEEFAEPDAVSAAARLVAAGAQDVVVLPFLVLRAGHAKDDIPACADAVRAAFPALDVTVGDVLGLQTPLFALARRRIDDVSRPEERGDAVLVVTGAGSSDADANGDLAKATRVLAETSGFRRAELAFAGVTWPTADEAFRRAADAPLVVHFSWSLLAGLLEQRVAGWAAEVAAETGVEIRDAGRFGPDPLLADAVVTRYLEARRAR